MNNLVKKHHNLFKEEFGIHFKGDESELELVGGFIEDVVKDVQKESWEEAIQLSDEIEKVEPDGGTREWMAFKRFRNTLHDYLQALTQDKV